jgi:hypothetical protein
MFFLVLATLITLCGFAVILAANRTSKASK